MNHKITPHQVVSMDTDLDFYQTTTIKNLIYGNSTDFYREFKHIRKTKDGQELINPKASLMSLFLPYVLDISDPDMKQNGAILRLVNRQYKPFGIGYGHRYLDLTDKRFQTYRYTQPLTAQEIKSLVDCYPTDWQETSSRITRFKEQGGYIAFYGDGCSPWHSEAKFKAYMKRLTAFCDLIDAGKIERVN